LALSGQADAVGDKFSEVATFPSGVYLLTSAPVRDQNDALVGVMPVGTRLDVLLSNVKAETLADVVVLDQSGHVAATLAERDGGFDLLALTPEQMPRAGTSSSRDMQLYGRGYRVLYAP
jgi:hypothetical protein